MRDERRMMIVDGHLDLAMNALDYEREQTWSLERIRGRDAEVLPGDGRGTAGVCLSELERGGVGLVTATLFVRAWSGAAVARTLRRSDTDRASPGIAHAMAAGQMAYYRWLERRGRVRIVEDAEGLPGPLPEEVMGKEPEALPGEVPGERGSVPGWRGGVRLIVLMEGADAVTEVGELGWWRSLGVRALGLTHTESNRWASGNRAHGPVTAEGLALLSSMEELGLVLDVSHLCDASLEGAMDHFGGRVMASHSNCRTLTPGHRQMTDGALRELMRRDGVVGVVFCHSMLARSEELGTAEGGPLVRATLERVADHVDHLCQLAGDAFHVGIGSDLDGGFGMEWAPAGIQSVADLGRLGEVLSRRGFGDGDVAGVMGGNWLRFWRGALSVGRSKGE